MMFEKNGKIDHVLNPIEAAKFLQLKKTTVMKYARDGKLPSVKKNHRRFFLRSQLVDYILNSQMAAS